MSHIGMDRHKIFFMSLELADLVIVTGNPGVFQGYCAYPYLRERVQVSMGQGKGFYGSAGFLGVYGFVWVPKLS